MLIQSMYSLHTKWSSPSYNRSCIHWALEQLTMTTRLEKRLRQGYNCRSDVSQQDIFLPFTVISANLECFPASVETLLVIRNCSPDRKACGLSSCKNRLLFDLRSNNRWLISTQFLRKKPILPQT